MTLARFLAGLRVSPKEEYDGPDLSMQGERAYDFS